MMYHRDVARSFRVEVKFKKKVQIFNYKNSTFNKLNTIKYRYKLSTYM